MTDDHNKDITESDCDEALLREIGWGDGCEALAQGRFWDAHEQWEALWRLVEPSPAREALQALIQFAVACHKTVQAREGADVAGMQRGMDALVTSGLAHLEAAEESGSPRPGFAPGTLRAAFESVAEHAERWRAGEDVEAEVARVARECAERLMIEAEQRPVRFDSD